MASMQSAIADIEASDIRRQYVTQRTRACDPSSGTVEVIFARFPRRHSCQYCAGEIIHGFTTSYSRLRDVDGAIDAADCGCAFYEWLLDFVIRSRAAGDLVGEEGLFMRCKSSKVRHPNPVVHSNPNVHSVEFTIGNIWYSWPCASFDVFTEAGNPSAEFITSRPFNARVDSESARVTAKNWLVECHKNHEGCRSPIPGFLPTRILDLKDAGDMGSVRIVSSRIFVKSTQPYRSVIGAVYATLSYCWGGEQPTKTTKSNYQQHLTGIPVSRLSQTLQDAIKVTRSLGIRFLWVDSLCIIQDYRRDVAKEIAKMSDYYENSFISISAAVAASCDEGFLKTRTANPYLYGPFELPHRGFAGGPLGSVKLVQYNRFSSSLEPIRDRAWILQEYLMAPRILSFGSQSLAWSCRTVNSADGGPYGGYYDFGDRDRWAKLQEQKMPGHSSFDPISRWQDIVRSYTARALTVSNDKLPAISGIAQEYAEIIELYVQDAFRLEYSSETSFVDRDFVENEVVPCPVYVGGLWYLQPYPPVGHHFFESQLLWHTSLGDFRHVRDTNDAYPSYSSDSLASIPRRNREYRAPSWSWAAVNGSIEFGEQEHVDNHTMAWDRKLKILDCRVSPEISEAPYGAVASGFLTVRGRIAKAPTASSSESITYRPDTYDDLVTLSQIMSGQMAGWILQVSTRGISFSKTTNPKWSPEAPKGLLLVEAGASYRRIGLFSLETEPKPRGFLRTQEPIFSDDPRTITII